MKRILIRGLTLLLTLALMASMASCARMGDGQQTTSQETTDGGISDTSALDSTESSADPSTPNFTVLDGDGNEVRLSDFFGKPIVLNFWTSWCPPCRSEMHHFEDAYGKYAGKVEFLMVNLTDGKRETVKIARDFVDSMGYTFPVYFDTEYEATYAYGIRSIPATYFIAADGSVEAHVTGMISASQLEEGIRRIYSE